MYVYMKPISRKFWDRSKLEPNGLRHAYRLTEWFLVLHFAAKNLGKHITPKAFPLAIQGTLTLNFYLHSP